MAERAETYTHGHAESVLRSHRWRTVDNSAAYLADRLVPRRRRARRRLRAGHHHDRHRPARSTGRVVGLDAAGDADHAPHAGRRRRPA